MDKELKKELSFILIDLSVGILLIECGRLVSGHIREK